MSFTPKKSKALVALKKEKLLEELRTTENELYTARIKHSQGELKDTHQLSMLRRYVAQIKTYIHLSS